jgi:hypothetical protein
MRSVLDALLSPIAHLAVARGVLFAEVAERLKAQFVRAAEQQISTGKPTDSRISVMTGLQRRDIVRLRDAPGKAARPVNHLARLVARWVADPAIASASLPMKGPAPSFDALARDIRQDVHPRTMLAQLQEAGTIKVVDEQVTLCASSYQPLPGSAAQLDYLAANAGDFLAAAVTNAIGKQAPFFERAVHYNLLSPQAVDELDAAFREGQMHLLESLNARAAALQDTSPGVMRFRAGGYFYKVEET